MLTMQSWKGVPCQVVEHSERQDWINLHVQSPYLCQHRHSWFVPWVIRLTWSMRYFCRSVHATLKPSAEYSGYSPLIFGWISSYGNFRIVCIERLWRSTLGCRMHCPSRIEAVRGANIVVVERQKKIIFKSTTISHVTQKQYCESSNMMHLRQRCFYFDYWYSHLAMHIFNSIP